MKNIGIVRKIDNLGRIVLPKELRKTLNINNGDDFQITIDEEKIILEKYSKLENFEDIINKIINCFSLCLNYNIYFVIDNRLLNNSNDKITYELEKIILERKIYYIDRNDKRIITNNIIKEGKLVLLPVVYSSDLLGSIIIIANDKIENVIKTAKIIDNLIKNLLLKN